MNEIQSEINRLILKAKAYDKGVTNPKYRNKLVARLEEAELIASRLFNEAHPGNQPTPMPPAYQLQTGNPNCICYPDSIDSDCPVHGSQSLDNVTF